MYLNANDIDADPTLIRDPDARHKTHNRSGQGRGKSKLHIPGPFSWRLIEMQESFAYRAMTLAARKILDRLEIELAKHGGKAEANGELICPYNDLAAYAGTKQDNIKPAIDELVALGFIRITRKGSAGNADMRQAAQYLLTYRHAGSHRVIEDGWRRIKSMEEAQTLVKAAWAKRRQSHNRLVTIKRKPTSAGAPGAAKNANPLPASRVRPLPASRVPTVPNPGFPAPGPLPAWELLSRGSLGLPKPDTTPATPDAAPPEPLSTTVDAMAQFAEALISGGDTKGRCPLPVSLEAQLRAGGREQIVLRAVPSPPPPSPIAMARGAAA